MRGQQGATGAALRRESYDPSKRITTQESQTQAEALNVTGRREQRTCDQPNELVGGSPKLVSVDSELKVGTLNPWRTSLQGFGILS